MNPWKIIGWIVLVLMLLSLTFCGLVCFRMADTVNRSSGLPSSAEPSDNDPVYHADIESLTCQERRGRTKVSVTIRNTGGNAIPFAKAYFRVGSESIDTYFSPTTIPAGSLASADRSASQAGDCQLVMIQDGQGHQVMFSAPKR